MKIPNGRKDRKVRLLEITVDILDGIIGFDLACCLFATENIDITGKAGVEKIVMIVVANLVGIMISTYLSAKINQY